MSQLIKYNIVIDLSWIANVYAHVLSNLSYNGYATGMLYGVYNFVKKLHQEHPNFIFHFCLDSRCVWRKELYPAYKGNRDEVPKLDTQDIIDLCRMLRGIPNTYFYKVPNTEADDLIAILAKELPNVIIYTGDNDMLQLLPLGVKIAYKYQHGDFLYKDGEYTKSKFGVAPCELKYFRFLSGDKSDNIPKIAQKIKTEEIIKFARKWYAKDFKRACETASKSLLDMIKENKEQLRINIKLMDLLLINKDKKIPEPLNVSEAPELFEKYGIKV